MKKVLFLATFDFNRFGGGSQAVRAYLDSILEIFGYDHVDVMLSSEAKLLEEYTRLNCIKIDKRSLFKSCYEIFKGSLERWTTPLLKYLKDNSQKYELVILNGSKSGLIIPQIKKMGIKVVTIHHNEEVEYSLDNKNIYTFGGISSFLVNRTQKAAYFYSDINLFLTNQDKNKFELMYGKPTIQINEVIGVYDYKSANIISVFPNSFEYNIGISGSLISYQTTHGIIDLITNYFDVIRDLIPDCKILLTGKNPSTEIIKIANDYCANIDILANPIDIISIIQKCSIYLCPTDIGGGLKLRAMDGLKSGMPILVHKVSARGYDIFWGKPYFKVYDDKETFRKGLIELLEYVSKINNRKHISEDYYAFFGYEVGTNRFENLFRKIR